MRSNLDRLLMLGLAVVTAGSLAACGDDNPTDPGNGTPDAPSNVAATSSSTTAIQVTWDVVPGADAYEVDRAEGSAGTLASVATALSTTFYADAGLTASTEYCYVVRAVEGTKKSANSTKVCATTGAPGPKVAKVTGVTLDRTFYSDTTYVLSGYVKVSNGAKLTIQPGTRIVGDTLVPGSSLWILRGSQIVANGTAANPIVFTSARAAGSRKPGDWGGIIIIGNGLINRTADPIFTEGPTGAAENYAGGTDFNDSSGSLTYVRVEFAGYDVSNGAGQELNSISNYAVGRGTKLDYVELLEGLDDGIESFGGAGDYRHILSFETGDDHFDWTEGFEGRAQFLIALQTTVPDPRPGTGVVSSDPRGFEGDGCEIDKAGCTYANAPYSAPVWANFTVIGPGTGVFSTTDGSGAVVRRGSGGTFVNGIIGRWPGVGISVRNQESKDLLDADSLYFRNIILAENGSNFEPAGTNFGATLADSASAWNITTASLSAVFGSALPTGATTITDTSLDLVPTGAAANGGMTSFTGTPIAGRVTNYFGASMPATAYVGAVDPSGTPWYQGWTNFDRN